MNGWRERLNDFLEGKYMLFERDYIITYPCKFKINGMWVKAKIDLENGVIYDLKGNILRRCNLCQIRTS
jgi:hypothetical protein